MFSGFKIRLTILMRPHRSIRAYWRAITANSARSNAIVSELIPVGQRDLRSVNASTDTQEKNPKCPAPGEDQETFDTAGLAQDMSEVSTRSSPAASSTYTSQGLAGPGKLVVQNGGYKFHDNYIWVTIHDNLVEMRHILDQETSDDEVCKSCDSPVPHEDVDLLLSKTPALNLADDIPLPFQILRLWQIFLERVNPVTKMLHTPTTEQLIISAMTNHSDISNKSRALLFAIYLLSVVSLSDEEAMTTLNLRKDKAIQRFTKGLKTALSKVNFLRNYDMEVLQALVLYLISLRGRSNHDAVWVLSGVVIRIANKMGVHRDGDTLDLTPFETEIRRRVWWQIIVLDSMYAATSGMKPTFLPTGSNTRMPQNVNDTDFSAESTVIKSRDGPTDMAFVLVLYEIIDFIREHLSADFENLVFGGRDIEPGTPEYITYVDSLNELRTLADQLDARIGEVEKQYCDPSGNVLRNMALNIRSFIVNQAKAMATPIHETPEWGTEVNNSRDNFYRIWITHNENEIALYETAERSPFLYMFKCFFHLDSLLFLASQLVDRSPVGSLADRTWRLFDRFYYSHEQLWNFNQRSTLHLARLLLKAWGTREKALQQIEVSVDEPPFISKLKLAVLQTEMMWMGYKDQPAQIPGSGFPQHHLDPMQFGEALQDDLLQDSSSNGGWMATGNDQSIESQTPVLPLFGFFNSTATSW
ncbi:hypothetical protein FHETE_7825 [Fusarium heterosporum]|uniref:Xylanolytic transcriptional activator regulatory domain-containing protein n=1 Tax=Fusarium heterosporum TaxID=42747 RepID=A0A8H5WLY2_FUSHE|nr:hypothetical protein FHETE_7825 [Fusarium heterosporum]